MGVSLVVAVVLIPILICSVIIQHLRSPLRSFSGPWLAQYTNLWRLIDVWKGRADLTHRKLHKRYGSVVRLGPNFLSLSDPAMIKAVYSTRSGFRKSEFYSTADTLNQGKKLETQFTTANDKWHDYIVKPIRSSYTLASVLQFEGLVDRTLNYLMYKIEEESVTGPDGRKQCDIGKLLHLYAWDVMGQITFSERLGALDGSEEVAQLQRDGHKAIKWMAVVGQMPIIDKFLRCNILGLGPPGFKIAADWAAEKLRARYQVRKIGAQAQRDYLDAFIDAENSTEGDGKQMSPRQISWLIANTVAGSDTIAATLQAAVYHVAHDKRINDRLVAEIDEANRQWPNGLDWRRCQELPYVDAVIKETLRIAPGVGLPLERVVPDGGLSLPDGRFVPAGTVVGMNGRVVSRDETAFGKNADEFYPDRWLRRTDESEKDFKVRVARMKDADLTFGFGHRGCFGKNIAILELYKTIVRLYATYEISLVDRNVEWKVLIVWFVKQYNINVHIRRRDEQRYSEKEVSV